MQVRKASEAVSEIQGYREQMSPIGPYFLLNSPNSFSANRSVVDSNHITRSYYVLEKHSKITCFKVTN